MVAVWFIIGVLYGMSKYCVCWPRLWHCKKSILATLILEATQYWQQCSRKNSCSMTDLFIIRNKGMFYRLPYMAGWTSQCMLRCTYGLSISGELCISTYTRFWTDLLKVAICIHQQSLTTLYRIIYFQSLKYEVHYDDSNEIPICDRTWTVQIKYSYMHMVTWYFTITMQRLPEVCLYDVV